MSSASSHKQVSGPSLHGERSMRARSRTDNDICKQETGQQTNGNDNKEQYPPSIETQARPFSKCSAVTIERSVYNGGEKIYLLQIPTPPLYNWGMRRRRGRERGRRGGSRSIYLATFFRRSARSLCFRVPDLWRDCMFFQREQGSQTLKKSVPVVI